MNELVQSEGGKANCRMRVSDYTTLNISAIAMGECQIPVIRQGQWSPKTGSWDLMNLEQGSYWIIDSPPWFCWNIRRDHRSIAVVGRLSGVMPPFWAPEAVIIPTYQTQLLRKTKPNQRCKLVCQLWRKRQTLTLDLSWDSQVLYLALKFVRLIVEITDNAWVKPNPSRTWMLQGKYKSTECSWYTAHCSC